MLLDGTVAFARLLFQTMDVQETNSAPMVIDEAQLLEITDGLACTHSSHSKHGGQKILGDRQVDTPRPVRTQQQPSCEALLYIVLCIAASGLRNLVQLRLDAA